MFIHSIGFTNFLKIKIYNQEIVKVYSSEQKKQNKKNPTQYQITVLCYDLLNIHVRIV